jgi:hypothetical protein
MEQMSRSSRDVLRSRFVLVYGVSDVVRRVLDRRVLRRVGLLDLVYDVIECHLAFLARLIYTVGTALGPLAPTA